MIRPGLRDLSFRVTVGTSDQRELQKINKDFANSYRVAESDVMFKEPFKARVEAIVEDQRFVYVINGGKKVFRIPRAGLKQTTDISVAPGKRQTPFDFGVLAESLFKNYMVAQFVRVDGKESVYDCRYVASLKDTSRYRVWVDPVRGTVARREWYGQKGNLMAVFTYSGHTEAGGLWIPGAVEVKNSEGKFAGRMTYSSVKVNTGLSDDLFKVD